MSPWTVVLAGGLAVVSVFSSTLVLEHAVLTAPLRLLIALVPVPFFVGFIIVELRWVRQCDEFHRGVILESLAIAFPAAIVLAVTVEALQKAGHLTGWTVGDVWPFMALLWLPSLWLALRRYR